MTIKDELLALETKDRIIHAEDVVKWARKNKNSLLHSQFVWDDSKAAHEYRLYQARRLITLNIISEDREPERVNLRIDRPQGGGYRRIEDVIKSKDLSAHMLDDALQDLRRVKARYQTVKELVSVWDALDDVERRHKPSKEIRLAG